jgi:hypothetical protein
MRLGPILGMLAPEIVGGTIFGEDASWKPRHNDGGPHE